MRIEKIEFKPPTFYKGKNGYGDCYGIELTDWSSQTTDIHLTTLNSKGSSTAVKIAIPKKEINNLIQKLKTFI